MSMQGKRILFWNERTSLPMGKAFSQLLNMLGVKPRGEPQEFVRHDIPWADREELAKALAIQDTMNPSGGNVLMGYMGFAECRICGERLGTRDLFGYGFIWPEKAEHYILVHKVWTPDCSEMLKAVRIAKAFR